MRTTRPVSLYINGKLPAGWSASCNSGRISTSLSMPCTHVALGEDGKNEKKMKCYISNKNSNKQHCEGRVGVPRGASVAGGGETPINQYFKKDDDTTPLF